VLAAARNWRRGRDHGPDPARAVTGVPPPARAIWFDLAERAERPLPAGQAVPDGPGFLWIDLELPAAETLAALVASRALPAAVLGDEPASGEVSMVVEADHVRLALAGARMHERLLVLDRRGIVVSEGGIASLHRGCPRYLEEIRGRYGGGFPTFARSHGFLLFEMAGHLVDDLKRAVRDLGDEVDALRLGVGTGLAGAELGAELLSSILLLRRVLVRTGDLLAELASRRFVAVPESTQPYLRDIAGRLEGLVADLAFSRDVLSEALRMADERPAGRARVTPASPPEAAAQDRPPLRFSALGRFAVERAGEPIPDGAFGAGPARALLAALLCSRRAVTDAELAGWIRPGADGSEATLALEGAVEEARRALSPDGAWEPIVRDGAGFRLVLGPQDGWDVLELLGAPARAGALLEVEGRIEVLSAALERHAGPVCPEWPHAPWSAEVREECAEARRAVRAGLAEALLQVGRPDEAARHFEILLADEPAAERWHRGLMRAHHDAGRHAVALRQYHTCRSVLRQGQGAEPEPETQALYLELLREG
jgi:DNA-binding SARP family transcriptional activator/Mg2+ and Co2+ transporter CorA